MAVPHRHCPCAGTVADRPAADKLGPAGTPPPRPGCRRERSGWAGGVEGVRLAPEAGHNGLGTADGWMRPWRSWAATWGRRP